MLCSAVSYSLNFALSNSVPCCRGLGTNMSTTSRSCIEWGWVINLLFLTKWVRRGKTSFATAWKVTQRWGGQPASSSTILLSRFVSQLWLQNCRWESDSLQLAVLCAAVPQGFVSWQEADTKLMSNRKKARCGKLRKHLRCCSQTSSYKNLAPRSTLCCSRGALPLC